MMFNKRTWAITTAIIAARRQTNQSEGVKAMSTIKARAALPAVAAAVSLFRTA